MSEGHGWRIRLEKNGEMGVESTSGTRNISSFTVAEKNHGELCIAFVLILFCRHPLLGELCRNVSHRNVPKSLR